MSNKYFFIIVIAFIFEDIISIFALFIVSYLYLYLQSYYKPYACDSFNRVALMSRVSSHTILFCSMASNVEGSGRWMFSFLALLGLVIVLFFAFWIHSFLQFQSKFVRIWNKVCPSRTLHFQSTEVIIESFSNLRSRDSVKSKVLPKSTLDSRSSRFLEKNWVSVAKITWNHFTERLNWNDQENNLSDHVGFKYFINFIHIIFYYKSILF